MAQSKASKPAIILDRSLLYGFCSYGSGSGSGFISWDGGRIIAFPLAQLDSYRGRPYLDDIRTGQSEI